MKTLLREAPLGSAGIEELAALVAAASDAELAAWMSDPATRKPLLDLIYEAAVEALGTDPLDCDDTIVHFHVAGSPQGGCDSFQLMLRDGIVLPGHCLTRLPDHSFQIGSVELLRLVGQTAKLRI